jgi:penicillin-binding protein 2
MSDLLLPRTDVGEFRRRFKWMALIAFLAFGVVVSRLFQLQVLEGASYAAIAHENIIRHVTLPTTRGVIHDREGKVLASSRAAYDLYVVPGRVMRSARPAHPGRLHETDDVTDTWPRIADILRLNPEERAHFDTKLHAACATDEDKSPCWRPVLVRQDLARDTVAELKQHDIELVGSEVVRSPVRYYPYKNLAAHTIGYVAEIDAEALAKYRPVGYETMEEADRQRVNPLNYESGDILGSTGVERAWESYLRGQRGWEERIVDARGRYRTGPEAERLLDQASRQDPIPGRDVRLTLDIELEEAVEKAMRNQRAGAVVVVEVRTGRLLAMYSKPDFDPNDLSGGAGKERMRQAVSRLYGDPLQPTLDKTTSGSFQPGSTFKPFSALAALEGKKLDPDDTERCDGQLTFGRRVFHCTHVHGRVNMHQAIAESCNMYFIKVAEAVGMDDIAKMATQFGLGEKTGLGVNPEATGRMPTRSFYALRYGGKFYEGYTMNAAIGEGATTVTPLQLSLAYAALGNGGTLYSPELVRAVESEDGTIVQDFAPRVRRKVNVSPANLARVTDSLYGVVNEQKGTAYDVRDPGLDVAGKTGTAQTAPPPAGLMDTIKGGMGDWYRANHAWFAAYAPAKAPEIAVALLVEHGGAGPKVAAPIALQIVRDYERITAVRAGRPPPPPKPPKGTVVAAPAPHPAPPMPPSAEPSAPPGEPDLGPPP